MRIKKAIVLAAGLGTRLRPFTCAVPKPLLPVWGEPMLARIIAMLREWGVTDIVVNCHYLHEQVEAWCKANSEVEGPMSKVQCPRSRGRLKVKGQTEEGNIPLSDLSPLTSDLNKVRIRASYEPEILGTGGVLNPLREWIGEEPFYLVNGDIVVEGVKVRGEGEQRNFSRVERGEGVKVRGEGEQWKDENSIGWCLVTEEGPRTIEVEPESGFVTNWKSDDAGYDGTFTYCGIAALKPEILKYVEPTGFSTIVQAYERAMMDGKFMAAICPKGMLWTDAGTIASYIEINQDGEDNAFGEMPQIRELKLGVEVEERKISFLGARGSDRAFFKVGDSIAIIYDDAKRGENARYAGHAKWLAAKGIRVPEILADRPDLKTLVMSWAGSEKKMTLEEDVKVIEALVKFNALGAASDLPELEPPFDAALYKWERDLFEEHCLGTRFHGEMSAKVREELENVAALLEREPKALVHRDFQSTNVLWKNGQLTFIDFQGMRLGPAAYDLASFVYDPYVKFTEGERRALIKLYAKEVEKVGEGDEVKVRGEGEQRNFSRVERGEVEKVGEGEEVKVIGEGEQRNFSRVERGEAEKIGEGEEVKVRGGGGQRNFSRVERGEVEKIGGGGDRGAGIIKITPFAAVERLVQCLGAYGRLASVGQPQFGKWVLPALENLLAAADEAGLDAVGGLAEELIAEEVEMVRRVRDGEKGERGHDCHCGHHHEK